jgi:hypothetical protein
MNCFLLSDLFPKEKEWKTIDAKTHMFELIKACQIMLCNALANTLW